MKFTRRVAAPILAGGIALAGLFVIAVFLIMVFRALTNPMIEHFGDMEGETHGSARFATDKETAALARAAGLAVALVPGEEENFKITGVGDLARARRRLEAQMDIRTGTGFDVHAFGPGEGVWLCGVLVPHERGLVGHADARGRPGVHDLPVPAVALTAEPLGHGLGDAGDHQHQSPSSRITAGTSSSRITVASKTSAAIMP
mgnify:CR=1 FL=1